MLKKKLYEIANVQAGGTPSRTKSDYWNGNIPWIKISNINSKFVDSYDETITKQGLDNSSAKMFPKNTILYTIFATLGRVGILTFDATTNQAIAGIQLTDSTISNEYLYYYLRSLESYVNKIGNGAAQKNINLSILKNFNVPIVGIERQNEITSELCKLEIAISLKKNELESLNELIKSQFIEMFDNKGYPSKIGNELFKFSSGKFLDVKKRLEAGIPVYGGNGIAWYTDESLVNDDTIIIGRVGAYCGNARLVRGDKWITDNALYISKFKTNDFELEFLEQLMIQYDFHQYAGAAAQPKITQKPLDEQMYLIPPKSEQIKFTEFVKQIDKSKFIFYSKNFLWDVLTFSSSTIAYSNVVSIFAWPRRC